MKKIVIINILLVFVLQTLNPLVYAIENEQLIASGQCGENLEWKITEEGHFVISGLGKMNDFESVSNTPWYSYRSSITTITISNEIENIGKNAFYYCSNVSNIEIGSDVKTIGDYAFYNCKNLKNIIIPDSVTDIGTYAFNLGSSAEIEYVKVSKNISKIGATAFYFKKLDKTIYNGTLDQWANINFVGQQANPIYYSHNLYNENGEITNVKLNSTKTFLYAFCNWSALESIELAEGTTEIPSNAFKNCQNLESITIPDSVSLIGEDAFSSCTSLKNIILPNEIDIIPSHLFYNCTSLESIIIPKNVTEISKYSFYNCSSLKEIDLGVIEAAKSMGATNFQIITKVLLTESKPSLLVGAAISITTILGYSAMAGAVGGGGLGDVAIRYGYNRYDEEVLFITVILLVIIVQIIQAIFMSLANHTDKRI